MEIDYPYLTNEQIKTIREQLLPKLKSEGLNNFDELEEAEDDGFEWSEIFEDLDIKDLSHISNKQLGLKDDASQQDRDRVFLEKFGWKSGESAVVTTLIWSCIEECESW